MLPVSTPAKILLVYSAERNARFSGY